jgi:hypothetical protein
MASHLHLTFGFQLAPLVIEGYLIAAKDDPRNLGRSQALDRHNLAMDRGDIVGEEKEYSKQVIELATGLRRSFNLAKLVEKIEMLSRFQFAEAEG